jgi:hypothetical protein
MVFSVTKLQRLLCGTAQLPRFTPEPPASQNKKTLGASQTPEPRHD